MMRLLGFVLVLALIVGAVGYWRGWFSVSKEQDKIDVQVDSAKYKKDKKAFSESVSEKATAIEHRVENLWKKSDKLTGKEKAQVQDELRELNKKHDRIEKQIKELEDADQNRFDSLKQDLEKTLKEVNEKIEELTKKLD